MKPKWSHSLLMLFTKLHKLSHNNPLYTITCRDLKKIFPLSYNKWLVFWLTIIKFTKILTLKGLLVFIAARSVYCNLKSTYSKLEGSSDELHWTMRVLSFTKQYYVEVWGEAPDRTHWLFCYLEMTEGISLKGMPPCCLKAVVDDR